MDQLVTLFGGGGFLGRYAAQGLLRAGVRVRIAGRRPREAWFLKPLGGLGQTEFVAADITRPDSVARAVAGSTAVVNLVGILSGDFDRMHVDGARNIAEAAAQAGIETMVQISALGADPASPSAYGRSKGEGEAAVRTALPAATILRPSIVFGPEDQFVNRFAAMIAALPVVPIVRAEARFQPVWVRDVAEAIVASILNPLAHRGQTYELGGPEVMTMAEVNRYIAGAIGRARPMPLLPDAIGAAMARLGFLPGAPMTWDQWLMLQADNVVAPDAEGLAAFGIEPTPLAAVAPQWLVRFRRHGRFGVDPKTA